MRHTKVSPPDPNSHSSPRQRTEEDVNIDLIRQLAAEEAQDVPEFIETIVTNLGAMTEAPIVIPSVIASVLSSPDGKELVAIATMLHANATKDQFIRFITPVGDIRCKICWMSCRPDELKDSENLFFVKIRTADASFIPKSGATFDVGFSATGPTYSVVCLAPPQPLYPGIDLMCFLPHNNHMEKNGKLNESVPDEEVTELPNSLNGDTPDAIDFDTIRKSN
jgi:hypothetical protein